MKAAAQPGRHDKPTPEQPGFKTPDLMEAMHVPTAASMAAWTTKLKLLASPYAFITIVWGLAAGYFWLVEWRVRSIIKHPDFVAEVARQTSPSIVFDTEGRILADKGALRYLEKVPEVRGGTNGIIIITVHPKVFIAAEPILQALDESEVAVTAKRTTGTKWEITVRPRMFLLSADAQPGGLAPARYRLELTPP